MSSPNKIPLRIVLAKVGLDGHDRGIKVVARGLRDHGCHVIYSGLWKKVDEVVRTVADEDADYLGISILSGAHNTLAPRIMHQLEEEGLEHVGVIFGGIIPAEDIPKLSEIGVVQVFGPGTTLDSIAEFLDTNGTRTSELPSWESLTNRDRSTLNRWISAISRGQELEQIVEFLDQNTTKAQVVAVTGNGGVGKSTLVGKLIEEIRGDGSQVAVLACDPQSTVTGGALLGDRVRMPVVPDDQGRFIRSLAAPSGQQALAPHLETFSKLLGHFGFDYVVIETVGSGQGDTAVRDLADTLVLMVQPQTGDEMQWEKAGLLEIADIVVVHKGDLPGADAVVQQLDDLLNLTAAKQVPVLKASAANGEGISELWKVLREFPNSAGS